MEQQLLLGCLLAALLGALGQGTRFVAGIRKQADKAAADQKSFADVFNPKELIVSLVIGAVAGVLGYLGLKYGSAEGADFAKGTTVLGVMAAGYAGTDFIEAFVGKWLPK
jgi:putative chitinase